MTLQNDIENENMKTWAHLYTIQEKMQKDYFWPDYKNNVQYIKEQMLCLINEAMEALNEIPWKYWKYHQQHNNDKFVKELVDVQLFLVNLIISNGLSTEQFLQLCLEKQQTNISRIKENY